MEHATADLAADAFLRGATAALNGEDSTAKVEEFLLQGGEKFVADWIEGYRFGGTFILEVMAEIPLPSVEEDYLWT